MAKLEYDNTGRLLFTEEMRKEYTILIPQMLPVHFGFFAKLLERNGYNVVILQNEGRSVVDNGLKYVHNDACYPALLVIGQMIDAIENGGYDPHKIALLITQTGGGCRASNYIHMLRKALEKAGLEYIPVISASFGLEKNPGFKITIPLIRQLVYGMMYGDIIMNVANQTRPYEIPTAGDPKVRVGVVGEIYIKFSSLGNNQLEQFLLDEGAEPVVPGLTDFMAFKIYNRVSDVDMFGGSKLKRAVCRFFMGYIEKCQEDMIDALKQAGFRAPGTFSELHKLVAGYLNDGCKMGEGWLLTAEMLELIHTGTPNIVCAQPFGCLPNHIVGKGMIRVLKDDFPDSNIVAVDYDPGATKINQENRIKLMLANAKRIAAEEKKQQASTPVQ